MLSASTALAGSTGATDAISDSTELRKENQRLREEIANLRREIHAAKRQKVHRPALTGKALDKSLTDSPRNTAGLTSEAQRTVPMSAPINNTSPADENYPATLEKIHAPQQNAFLRRDRLEAFYYLYPVLLDKPDAKGASISWTKDYLASTNSIAVQGFGSYVLTRQEIGDFIATPNSSGKVEAPLQLSEYAVAPFVFANGTTTQPRKKSERNALQMGFDTQMELVGGGFFSVQNLDISPYFQTDYRGLASIVGLTTLWEPYKLDWRLGGSYKNEPQLLAWYWRAIAEADFLYVNTPGLTNFARNTDYARFGGTLQANGVLFANMSTVPQQLCGRISLFGSVAFFENATKGTPLHNWHGEIDYNLNGAPAFATVGCEGGKSPESGPQTKTTLALTFDEGTDQKTLEKRRKYSSS